MNSGDPTSGSSGTGGMARTFTDDDLLLIEVAQSAANNNGSGFVMNFGQDPTFAEKKQAGRILAKVSSTMRRPPDSKASTP